MAKRIKDYEEPVAGKRVVIFIPDEPGRTSEVQFEGIWSMKDVRIAARLLEKNLRLYKKQLIERGEHKFTEVSDA